MVTATVPTGAFDNRGRLTKSTLVVNAADSPSTTADDALDTPITTEQHYTRDGQVWRTIYPAITFAGLTSNLPSAETVTASFNSLGMPTHVESDFGGGVTYVDTTTFDAIGRVLQRKLGGSGSAASLVRDFEYRISDGRIQTLEATQVGGTNLQHDTYTYDDAGNPSRIVRNPDGTAHDETECFSYDSRQRLTRAFTHPSTTSDCSAHATGGPAAYDESYAVGDLERLLAIGETGNVRTLDSSGTAVPLGSCSTAHTKPLAVQWMTAPGSTSPSSGHSYTYDCNGSRLSDNDQTTADIDYSHTWNAHNRLESTALTIGGSPAGTTQNVYAASGQRALRIDTAANGDVTKTVYLGVLEYKWESATPSAVQGLRTYSGSQRGYDGVLTWSATNSQDSLTVGLSSTGVPSRIYYTPYGTVRSGAAINGRGFLNQVADDNTGLNYLSNRYLDPASGQFLSVDPLVGKTGDPYLYAAGNPVALSDPTGLEPCPKSGCTGDERRDPREARDSNPNGGAGESVRGRRSDSGDSSNAGWDWAGEALFHHYVFGGGDKLWMVDESNGSWAQYMNGVVFGYVRSGAAPSSVDYTNGARSWDEIEAWHDFVVTESLAGRPAWNATFPVATINGEGMVGAQFLHGTNKYVGGFQIIPPSIESVSIDENGNTVAHLTMRYAWNDIIDPNYDYPSDKAKENIAETVGGYIPIVDPTAYDLRIEWTSSVVYVISPTGEVLSSSGGILGS